MDKQFSVRFFTSLLEAVQKLCREYLDFDQCVDVSGYLALEIDNYRKERFVISELLQSTGDVMSESYCTKAFKTQRRYAPNKSDESGVLKERNLGSRLTDEERTSNLSAASSKQTSARNSYSKNASSHTVARGDEAYHSDQSAMSGDYYQCPRQSNSEWNPVIGSVQSLNSPGSVGRTSSNKRSLPSTAELPNAKTLKIENTSTQHSFPTQFSDKSHLSADQSDGDTGDTTAQGSYTDTVHLPSTVQVKEEELDDCVLIDSADEADVRDIHNVLGADDSNSSMYDSSGLQMSFSSPGEGLPGMSDQSSSSHQKMPMSTVEASRLYQQQVKSERALYSRFRMYSAEGARLKGKQEKTPEQIRLLREKNRLRVKAHRERKKLMAQLKMTVLQSNFSDTQQ